MSVAPSPPQTDVPVAGSLRLSSTDPDGSTQRRRTPAEVPSQRRRDAVVGEPERRLARPEGRAELLGEPGEHGGRGVLGALVPVRVGRAGGLGQRRRVAGGTGPAGGLHRARDGVGEHRVALRAVGEPRRGGHGGDARAGAALEGHEHDHREPPLDGVAVRGHRGVRPPHDGLGDLADQGDRARVRDLRGRDREGALDEGRAAGSAGFRAHDPLPVLRTLTPRSRADGQPWLTGATWPGWALPQLNAPPSRHVEGPPTASSEPQKSVVVAW